MSDTSPLARAMTRSRPPDDDKVIAPAPTTSLSVTGLQKRYGKRVILRDVSLHLSPGEVVALLGPNGSGKTTCFYCIAGIVKHEAGVVRLDGADITGLPLFRRARLGLGYLPQEMSIFRGLSVAQNIMAVLELRHRDAQVRRDRLEALLEEFAITHLRDQPALALSGGERRRTEIARALAADPPMCCWTNPSRGWTRLRWAKSARWSRT
jgi:lipopolysaccharide export system ATP-binding protein